MAARGKTFDLFPEAAGKESAVADATGPAIKSVRKESRGDYRTPPHHPVSTAAAVSATQDTGQLWVAVTFPSLALEALDTGHREGDCRSQEALVVVETVTRRQCVIACNQVAVAKAITPGMRLSAAHALVEGLQVHQRQPGKEQALLQRLACSAARFSPKVSIAPPDALLLEVRGSLGLFGGMDALCWSLLDAMSRQRVAALLALAPAPRAALWLVQGGRQQRVTDSAALRAALAGLPLSATRWPESVIQLLQAMGIQSVGDCLRLPRDGLARRIGPQHLLELDQAAGKATEVRRDFLQQTRFKTVLNFDEEIEEGQRLIREIEPLLERLAAFLTRRQAAIQALELSLQHRSREPTREILRFLSPVTQAGPVLDVLEELLARRSLPAPVRGIRLRSGPLLDFQAATGRMHFAAGSGNFQGQELDPMERLLEKLQARLGEAACYRLQRVVDHRPEKAWARSFGLSAATGMQPTTASDHFRPLWLLDPPERLSERQGWPWYRGELCIERGPERIESGWWDGQDVARDYYVANSVAGIRLWIYRDRRPPHAWFLHGFLD